MPRLCSVLGNVPERPSICWVGTPNRNPRLLPGKLCLRQSPWDKQNTPTPFLACLPHFGTSTPNRMPGLIQTLVSLPSGHPGLPAAMIGSQPCISTLKVSVTDSEISKAVKITLRVYFIAVEVDNNFLNAW